MESQQAPSSCAPRPFAVDRAIFGVSTKVTPLGFRTNGLVVMDGQPGLSSKEEIMPHDDRAKVLVLLDVIAANVESIGADVSTLKADVSTLKADVSTLKADVSSIRMDLIAHRQETRNGFARVDAEFVTVRGELGAIRDDLAAHREETRARFEAFDRPA